MFENFIDGFRAAETTAKGQEPASHYDSKNDHSEKELEVVGDKEYTNVDHLGMTSDGKPKITSDESGLKRNLKGYHMQMISFGGAIGTGLFIGSGGTLASGGPGSLMLGFILTGTMLFTVVMALGELASNYPVAGSFAAYATRFIDSSWGFAMGWNYWAQWLIVLPLELTAASIVIHYWDPNEVVPQGVWVAIFLVALLIINFFGVRGYGEVEVFTSMIKILAVIIFIIVAIVIDVGGAPSGEYIGAAPWHKPGAFANGFKGFCSIFVTAAFAFAGTELIGLAAAETGNPRKEVPKASKQIFWRIIIFYVLSLFMVTLIVPYDNPDLLGGSYDANASPFVVAIRIGGIKALPSVMNAVILVSVLSVGNSAVYAGSRTMNGMALAGIAPKIFGFIDKKGRPTFAVLLSMSFGLLGFLIYAAASTDVFNWMLALSGLSTVLTWGSICACHIRFRTAWARQGHTTEELSWSSPLGVYGSYYGFFFNILVIIFQFYKAAFPIGEGDMDGSERAISFFQSFLTVPIVIVCFLGHKLWSKSKFVRLDEIDCSTGRRDPVPLQVLRQEREEARNAPIHKRIWNILF